VREGDHLFRRKGDKRVDKGDHLLIEWGNMRTISIKQFRDNLYGEIKDLPVVVTQKGISTFMVLPYAGKVTTLEKREEEKVTTLGEKGEDQVTTEEVTKVYGKCKVPYCSNRATGEGKVYNSGSGEEQVVELCNIHLRKSERR